MPDPVAYSPEAQKLLTANIPDRLWHYTSFGGLKGIVESGSIWATDLRFLNDTTELLHARHHLEKVIEQEDPGIEALRSPLRELLRTYIEKLFTSGPLCGEFLQAFVACFSESKDQLSQWRGYSHQSSGVSIGFDLREIRNQLDIPLSALAPCIYDDEHKQRVLREVAKGLLDEAHRMMRLTYDAALDSVKSGITFDDWNKENKELGQIEKQLDKSLMRTTYDLIRVSALMKHSAFREEREWRLVIPLLRKFNDEGSSLIFSADSSSLTPRIAFKFKAEPLSIPEVLIGPGSHPHSVSALSRFLTLHKINSNVIESTVPFRPTK